MFDTRTFVVAILLVMHTSTAASHEIDSQLKLPHEEHFSAFRKHILGYNTTLQTPFGVKPLLYADWIASGRLYRPIEEWLLNEVGPMVANTHTETSYTGAVMTHAYHMARELIKRSVNAGPEDVLIAVGTGMTAAVNKFQRILGMKYPDCLKDYFSIPDEERPVVFITHMEHHSNQTSWLETIAYVELIKADADGLVDLNHLDELLEKHKHRKYKYASVTGCSNVTGIETPYYDIAERMHRAGGCCFVDFACSGPYVDIDMHPADRPLAWLDAIFLSPHKFLGGPGTPGILIFNKKYYRLKSPDIPGGGTVTWTNPWGGHSYYDDIEVREDGGTPGFLQLLKAAKAFQLKEELQPAKIREREHAMVEYIFDRLECVPGLHILAGNNRVRLGAISFYIDGLHYNLGVKLLNDLYGIQVRGGCSCAGTYGHYLLGVDEEKSKMITDLIDRGDLTLKPGWIRLSLHPVMTADELRYIADAIEDVALNFRKYQQEYIYHPSSNTFTHKSEQESAEHRLAARWFK
ncbi:MAG: aminotransferase class V-fold PLP-dependent enzyme [Thermaurantimonas sp.]|uniref:aminotransferase class V-fold PLP-dependent enzyme n=1 Tax=Thermaurantimonas sp. TaxID=2681568 RepID=UPI0039188F76